MAKTKSYDETVEDLRKKYGVTDSGKKNSASREQKYEATYSLAKLIYGNAPEVTPGYIKSFLDDTSEFMKGYALSTQGMDWDRAMSETRRTVFDNEYNSLREREAKIRSYLEENRNSFDPAYYDKLTKAIDDYHWSIVKAKVNNNKLINHFAQYTSQDDWFNNSPENYEQRIKKYEDAKNQSNVPGFLNWMGDVADATGYGDAAPEGFEDYLKVDKYGYSRYDYDLDIMRNQKYLPKYEKMGYIELAKASSELPDGEEKEWLDSYIQGRKEDYHMSLDGKAIEEAEKAYKNRFGDTPTYDAISQATNEQDAEIIFNHIEALNAKDMQKKAKETQKKAKEKAKEKEKYLGVGDPRSEYYDPDFAQKVASVNGGELALDWIRQFGRNIEDAKIQTMKPEEIETMKYHYAVGGIDAVEKYLDLLDEDLSRRYADYRYEKMEGNTGLEILFGIEAGLNQFANGLEGWFTDEAKPYDSTEILQSYVSNDLANVGPKIPFTGGKTLGQAGFDTVTTLSNMAPTLAISTVAPTTGAVLMGASAGGNAYQEKLRAGYSADEAAVYGILVGTSEALLERFIGSAAKVGKKGLTKLTGKALDSMDNVFSRFAKTWGGQVLLNAGSEGVEEFLQSVLEPFMWQLASGEEATVELEEAVYSALMGAFTGGMLGGGMATVKSGGTAVKQTKTGRSVLNANKTGGLIGIGNDTLGIAPDSSKKSLEKQIKNVGDKVSSLAEKNAKRAEKGKSAKEAGWRTAKAVGKLYDTVSETTKKANRSQDVADISAKLKDLGRSDHEKMADAIVASVNREELSNSQVKLLKTAAESKAVQTVLDEIVNNPESDYGKRRQALSEFTAEVNLSTLVAAAKKASAKEKGVKLAEDGKAVNPDGFVEEDGELKVKTDDGTVSHEDMRYDSTEQGIAYETIYGLGITDAAEANRLLNGHTEADGLTDSEWSEGITDAFLFGRAGVDFDAMATTTTTAKLLDTQRMAAYRIGQAHMGETDTQDNIDLRNALKEEGKRLKRKPGEKGVYVRNQDGSYTKVSDYMAANKDLNKRQTTAIRVMQEFSDVMGARVNLFQAFEEDGKKYYINHLGKKIEGNPNGFYDKSTGEIYVAMDAGATQANAFTDTMLFTFAHEVTHFIKDWSPTHFEKIASTLIRQAGFDGKMADLIAGQQDKAMRIRKEKISEETALEELVADSMETILRSGRVVETMAKIKKVDAEAHANLKGWFKKLRRFLRRMVAVYGNQNANTAEGQIVEGFAEDLLQQLEQLFAEGAVEAGKNYKAAKEQDIDALAEDGIAFDEETDSVFALRDSFATNDVLSVGRKNFDVKAVAEMISNVTGRSIEDSEKWVRSELTIANMVLANPEFLDFAADSRYEAIKKNSDYPQGTVDLSNLCPKREEFTAMFDLLQKTYPNKLFTAQDIAEMRKILSDAGITVACGACFVEDRRQLIGEIADTFIEMWKEAVNTGAPLKKTNADGKKIDLLVTKELATKYGLTPGTKIMATDTYIPNQYDLTTYEGFKLLEKNHPQIAMGFNRYNNSRGQQSARLIEGRAEYKRQILGWTPAKVKSVNNNGGLRIFSFSDFEVVHLLDLVQVVIDCAAKGVKIQGYTKIPAFAKLVRNTGIKLNRSLIPLGDLGYHMEGGKVVLDYDSTEGIDINDDNFLDERNNPNVGNIVIGINPTQIGAAMLDPFIDYIIPFHSNKAKAILKKLGTGEWINYKESQHERDISTGKASKKNVNIYTQVINKYNPGNKVEFVNAFLKECQKQGKIPRYAEFLNKEYTESGAYQDEYGAFNYTYREGYHKLLVDFKMFDSNGNILPQGEITPDLDNEFMQELLNAEVDRKRSYQFPHEVYDAIDKKFGDHDLAMSDRDDAYIAAVNRGDMETAQRMVDEAAKRAGYMEEVFHGMGNRHNVYKSGDGQYGPGVYFTYSDKVARSYGKVVDHLYVKVGKIADYEDAYKALGKQDDQTMDSFANMLGFPSFDEMVEDWDNDPTDVASNPKLIDLLTNRGFEGFVDDGNDGFVLWDFDGIEYRIKSADPVTYDDNGNVIPLSERFNTEKDDIRYAERTSNADLAEMDDTALYIKNTDKANYIGMIFNGTKTEETRSRRTLDAFIGKDFYVTDGKYVYGSIVLGEPHKYTEEEFHKRENQRKHRVPNGDEYDIKPGGIKWAYPIESYKKFDKPKKLSDSKEYKNSFQARQVRYSSHETDRDSDGNNLTKAQVEFFIDSKVRDKDGYLLVVYHGTDADFTVFDTKAIAPKSNQFAFGSHFTPTLEQAKSHGKVSSYYINIKNVLDVKNTPVLEGSKEYDLALSILRANRMKPEEWILSGNSVNTMNGFPEGYSGTGFYLGNIIQNANRKTIVNLLKKHGYDGVKYRAYYFTNSIGVGVPKYYDSYIIFDSNQAKLTTNLNPTSDPDTRYSERDTDSVSNRSLLANAFEGLAQTDLEKQKLQEYKENIAKLVEQDTKLKELRSQIKDLSFGSKDILSASNIENRLRNGERSLHGYVVKDIRPGVAKKRQASYVLEAKGADGKVTATTYRVSASEDIYKAIATKIASDARQKKIQSLQEEARKTANRIDVYDGILLRFESAESLRNVLERAKKKATDKANDRRRAALKEVRNRRDISDLKKKIRKDIMDLKKLYTLSKDGANVVEGMREVAEKALATAEVLFAENYNEDDMILNGVGVATTEDAQKLLAEAKKTMENLSGADGKIEQDLKRKLSKLKKQLKPTFEAEWRRINEKTATSLMDDLKNAYQSMEKSDKAYIRAAYDSKTIEHLEMIKENVGATRIADMTLDQLNELHKAYRMVLHSIRTANKAFTIARSISDLATGLLADMNEKKLPKGKASAFVQNTLNRYGWNYEKLYYALRRIDIKIFTELFTNLANSENTVMRDVEEAAARQMELVNQYGYKKWKVNRKIDKDFVDNTGKKFRLTLGEMMSLYAFSRRNTVWDHMEYGGFQFGKTALTDPNPTATYKLNKAQCEAITANLTKEQQRFVEEMQEYLSTVMAEKGNEVSMLLYGVKLFGEKDYFPLHVSGSYKPIVDEEKAKESKGFATMKNAGFTNAQNKNAKAVFVLEGFMDVWTDHVNEMSRYHGTVPALEDIRRVMNYAPTLETDTDTVAVKAAMESRFGKDAVAYFDALYREANSGAAREKLTEKSQKWLARFRKGSVINKVSVAIQQPGSISRAYAIIPQKYFGGIKGHGALLSGVVKAVGNKWTKAQSKTYEKMLKYAPGVTMAKEIGGFDTASGQSIKSYLMDTGKSVFDKIKTEPAKVAAGAIVALPDDALANVPNAMDKLAWIEIWRAAERMTAAQNPSMDTNTDAFGEKVGELFTETIRATQVYDSIFSKSPLLKSQNTAVQYMVSFMNEPNTTANMIEDAVRCLARGDKRRAVRTFYSVVKSVIFTNVLKALWSAARDDDEDETYVEKYIEALVGGLIQDATIFNYIPGARDVWSFALGYDTERPDLTMLTRVLSAAENLISLSNKDTSDMTESELAEWEADVDDATWDLIFDCAGAFGIGAGNIRMEVNAVENLAKTLARDYETTDNSLEDAVDRAITKSTPKLFRGEEESKTDKLYDAIVDGDDTYVNRIRSQYKDEDGNFDQDEYDTAVRKALRDGDPRIREAAIAYHDGDYTEYDSIMDEIEAEGHFDREIIAGAVKAQHNDMFPSEKESKDTVKAEYDGDDLRRAIVSGDAAEIGLVKDNMIQTDIANGKTEEEANESFMSKARSEIKKAFKEDSIDEDKAVDLLVEYGQEEEAAVDTVNHLAFQLDYPEYKDLSMTDVRDWYEYAEGVVPLDIYYDFTMKAKDIEGDDRNGDGKADSGSKKRKIQELARSYGLTGAQIRALMNTQ